MRFAERYTQMPADIPQIEGIVLPYDDPQRAVISEASGRSLESDWRQAPAAPREQPPAGGRGANARGNQPPPPPPPGGVPPPPPPPPGSSLSKAERAYTAADRQGITQYDKAIRSIRSILNKLAPEKFERLFQQLLEVITTIDVLRSTIALIFEKAVAEPSYCAMYAELCDCLAKELPEWPPAEGDDKPMTFRKVLLNTCNDEFDATIQSQASLRSLSGEDREENERRVKLRMLGNIRLIAELYKKRIVPEKIMYQIVSDLMGDAKANPHEDFIEALCELFSIAAKQLEDDAAASPKGKNREKLEGFFTRLRALGDDPRKLSPRVRFLVKDLLELKTSGWRPRREALQAKKLDEIRAEAEQSLGITLPGGDLMGKRVRFSCVSWIFGVLF